MTQRTLTPTRVIGNQVRTLRAARGLSATKLAQECEAAGAPALNRDVITNLENGRRQTLTVEEMLTLAYVLDAPPLALFVPLDGRVRLAVTPTIDMAGLHALEWVSGDYPPPAYDGQRRLWWRSASGAITLYRQFRDAARAAQRADIADPPPGPEEEKRLAARLADLAKVVNLMIGSGITPPALPGRWVRAMVADGHLDDPADVPISDED